MTAQSSRKYRTLFRPTFLIFPAAPTPFQFSFFPQKSMVFPSRSCAPPRSTRSTPTFSTWPSDSPLFGRGHLVHWRRGPVPRPGVVGRTHPPANHPSDPTQLPNFRLLGFFRPLLPVIVSPFPHRTSTPLPSSFSKTFSAPSPFLSSSDLFFSLAKRLLTAIPFPVLSRWMASPASHLSCRRLPFPPFPPLKLQHISPSARIFSPTLYGPSFLRFVCPQYCEFPSCFSKTYSPIEILSPCAHRLPSLPFFSPLLLISAALFGASR